MTTCPVPLVAGSEWGEDSRTSGKGMSELGALVESLAIIRQARAAGEGAGRRGPDGRTVEAGCTVSHHHGLGQLIFCSRRQAVDTAVLYLTVRNSFH